MIHDLDKTLENILIEEGKLNKKEIDISFDTPTGEWSARLNRPTLNLWCFDLRENLKLRGMERSVTRNNNRGQTSFPPRRIDLSYLVTAWARKIEDEHQLLWRALAALKRVPRLSPRDCEGGLRYQQQDIPLNVADMSYNAANIVDLWSMLENKMHLGFLVVTTLELDTEIGFEGPLVLDATVRVGQSEEPSEESLSALDVELRHKASDKQEKNHKEDD